MSKKKKTRIIIHARGQASEILSIRERTSGDLVVMPRSSSQIYGYTFEDTTPYEFRISLHMKRNWGGHTFIQHLRTADGHYRRWYAEIKRVNDLLLWPVVAGVCQNLSIPRYAMTQTDKDRIISLGHYDTKFDTLFYGLIVTSPGHCINQVFGLNQQRIEFSGFDVIIVWHFCRLPSCNKGFTHFPMVAIDFEKNGANERQRVAHFHESRTIEGIFHFLSDAFSNLSFTHFRNLVEILNQSGFKEPNGLEQATRRYVSSPSSQQ